MEFKKYPKIIGMHKEETVGMLQGHCVVQEKIDGANASIWMEEGKICCGSRNNKLTSDVMTWEENGDNGFNGFLDYVKNHEGIHRFFSELHGSRLCGEWLVKHTISYKETAYKNFFLFDIELEDKFRTQETVEIIAKEYDMKYPQIFLEKENPTLEEIKEFVGKTEHGDKGEGVVIKNLDFVNQFGDHCYGKIVDEKFKEDNGIVFGGNNKHSESYWEIYIMNKYVTLPRVQKVMQKLSSELGVLGKEHTPRVIQNVYHNMITEEAWDISKKVAVVDFKRLKIFCSKKARQIFFDVLQDDISVSDIHNQK